MALISQETMMQALDWGYMKAVDGLAGLGTASELAEDYRKANPTARDAAYSLINWQMSKAATSGFVTGLGGIITLPVAIPANIGSVLYIQIRLVAAIAHLAGHDIRQDHVKTLIYTCLAGSAAADVLKDAGIKFGMKMTVNLIRQVPGRVLIMINQRVGFRLATKAGTTGLINLGKIVPVVGGIIGGSFDAVSTRIIGNVALNLFMPPETADGAPDGDAAGGLVIADELAIEAAADAPPAGDADRPPAARGPAAPGNPV